jgi:hypothetical protein
MSVEGLHLVRQSNVRVQIRVAGTGVGVGERGRHQTGEVNLPNPVPALPSKQCVAFDEGQRIRTAARCACSINAATCGSATAHKLDTDLTGEKVRS